MIVMEIVDNSQGLFGYKNFVERGFDLPKFYLTHV